MTASNEMIMQFTLPAVIVLRLWQVLHFGPTICGYALLVPLNQIFLTKSSKAHNVIGRQLLMTSIVLQLQTGKITITINITLFLYLCNTKWGIPQKNSQNTNVSVDEKVELLKLFSTIEIFYYWRNVNF